MNAPAAPAAPRAAARAAAPVAATPQLPVSDGVASCDAAVFRWTAPPGARRFRLQVAAGSDFADLLVDLDGLTTTELTLADALPLGPLFWRVRAGAAPWSPVVPFRAGTAAEVAAAEADATAAAAEANARAREARR
ncbi:MAG TPA: hypothetical protein VK610_06730, partial [Rhodothermales bacterium]|nr:hypothetical protein [Rhodothermales bacterium]